MRTVRLHALFLFAFLIPALAPPALAAADWADQLTVYAIPATRRMRWSHPRALAIRTITNRAAFWHRDFKHSIGHVFVHLKSSSAGVDLMTGMTSRVRTEDQDLVLEDGYGLGVMGADMMGRLEDDADLRAELAAREETGLIASMKFRISPAASARLAQFLAEYRAQGLDDHYGGSNRPRYREGAGCSAFGVAFLDLAGLMRADFEDWRIRLRVPYRFYGGPLTGLRASVRALLLEGGRWAREDEPHVKLMLWDPTRMYNWIVATHRRESREPTGAWGLETAGMARVLVEDARATPVPAGPIWLEDPVGTEHPWGRQPSTRREVATDDDALIKGIAPEVIEEFLASHGILPEA